MNTEKKILDVLSSGTPMCPWTIRKAIGVKHCSKKLNEMVSKGILFKIAKNVSTGSGKRYLYCTVKAEEIKDLGPSMQFAPNAQNAIDSVSAIIDENAKLRSMLADIHSRIGALL